MTMSVSTRTFAALAALTAAAILPFVPLGCSSSSSPAGAASDAAGDQTADDGATADGSQTSEAGTDASSDVASMDSGGDGSGGASQDAADAVAEAAPGDAATCTPFDAALDPDAAAAGLILVADRNCTACHVGDFGGGRVVGGAYSKNITLDPATGLGCWTDDQIVTAILYGTTPDGQTLCVMPKWGDVQTYPTLALDTTTAEQVVQYLRTQPPVSRVVQPTDCVALGFGPDAGDAGSDAGDAQTPDASAEAAADGGPG